VRTIIELGAIQRKRGEVMERIEDLMRNAEVENGAIGADEYLRQSYSPNPNAPV
jgi:hypothetical protein